MPKIKVTPTARQDIHEGINYYNNKQRGLGKQFESIVHDTFTKISNMPEAASFAFEEIRYKIIDRFPYMILYEIRIPHIHILRVFNTHLDPEDISR